MFGTRSACDLIGGRRAVQRHRLALMATEQAIALLRAVLSDLRAVSEGEQDPIDLAAIGRMADTVEMAIAALSD